MSANTLPALPSTPHVSAESLLAQQLQRATSDGGRARLEIHRSNSDGWTLSASSDLSASELEAALSDAARSEMFHVPSNEEQAEAAVIELKTMTSRPVWMDGEDARVYEEALIQACQAYPIDVVQLACKAWRMVPQHGKWWPTEQDLRNQCEIIFSPRRSLFNNARVLLRELRDREEAEERARRPLHFTGDKFKRFRDEMEKRMTPARFDAYFHRSEILFKGDDVMLVRCSTAETVLRNEGADLLKEMGLRVVYCPVSFLNEKPRPFEPTSPEEKEEIVRKLKLMFHVLGKGGDIAAMRREGTL